MHCCVINHSFWLYRWVCLDPASLSQQHKIQKSHWCLVNTRNMLIARKRRRRVGNRDSILSNKKGSVLIRDFPKELESLPRVERIGTHEVRKWEKHWMRDRNRNGEEKEAGRPHSCGHSCREVQSLKCSAVSMPTISGHATNEIKQHDMSVFRIKGETSNQRAYLLTPPLLSSTHRPFFWLLSSSTWQGWPHLCLYICPSLFKHCLVAARIQNWDHRSLVWQWAPGRDGPTGPCDDFLKKKKKKSPGIAEIWIPPFPVCP